MYWQWTQKRLKALAIAGNTLVNKNLAIANRSRVSCTHNTSRASVALIIDDLEN